MMSLHYCATVLNVICAMVLFLECLIVAAGPGTMNVTVLGLRLAELSLGSELGLLLITVVLLHNMQYNHLPVGLYKILGQRQPTERI